MPPESAPSAMDLLDMLPDPLALATPARWINETVAAIAQATPERDGSTPFVAVGVPPVDRGHPLGAWADARWRRAVFALLVADWTCYETDDDRANFERLAYFVTRFPAGFRLWLSPLRGTFVPVGYTGWYAINTGMFEQLASGAPYLADRAIVPLCSVDPDPLIYLFNYSIAAPYRRSEYSRRMLTAYWSDVNSHTPSGLAAVTVSEDGGRVARRAKMEPVATLPAGDLTEDVYIWRRDR